LSGALASKSWACDGKRGGGQVQRPPSALQRSCSSALGTLGALVNMWHPGKLTCSWRPSALRHMGTLAHSWARAQKKGRLSWPVPVCRIDTVISSTSSEFISHSVLLTASNSSCTPAGLMWAADCVHLWAPHAAQQDPTAVLRAASSPPARARPHTASSPRIPSNSRLGSARGQLKTKSSST